jgi:hypothetical protein
MMASFLPSSPRAVQQVRLANWHLQVFLVFTGASGSLRWSSAVLLVLWRATMAPAACMMASFSPSSPASTKCSSTGEHVFLTF